MGNVNQKIFKVLYISKNLTVGNCRSNSTYMERETNKMNVYIYYFINAWLDLLYKLIISPRNLQNVSAGNLINTTINFQ